MATATAPARATATSDIEGERAWTDGSVWVVESIRVKSGQDLIYGRALADTWVKAMEEHKNNGLILSYKILAGPASNREDYTHLLMIEFPNYAALDQQEKMEATVKKMFGSLAGMEEMLRKREGIREAIGTRLLREMRFE